MKPVYANTFGLRKVSGPQGEIVEVTLDISYKYMDNTLTMTAQGLENVATPSAEPVASIVMTRSSALSLRNLLDKSLDGAERILGDCDRLGIRILTIQDAEYPERLRQIENPPCVLYVKGKLFPFDELVTVGVVGTRRPTEY